MSPLSRLVIAGKESRRLRICQYKLPILEKKKKDWKDQFSSVAQLCPTLCDPMNRSMPGLPVHHHLPEFTQTHVHQVSDAIQPSHPQSSFSSCSQSLPASESFPMSQLFTWGGQSTGVSALASFFQRNPRPDLLQNGLVGSPCSPRHLKSLLQHHSSKASFLLCSAFFMVQL